MLKLQRKGHTDTAALAFIQLLSEYLKMMNIFDFVRKKSDLLHETQRTACRHCLESTLLCFAHSVCFFLQFSSRKWKGLVSMAPYKKYIYFFSLAVLYYDDISMKSVFFLNGKVQNVFQDWFTLVFKSFLWDTTQKCRGLINDTSIPRISRCKLSWYLLQNSQRLIWNIW